MPSPSFSASNLAILLVVLELMFSYHIAGIPYLIETALPVTDLLFVQPNYFVMYVLVDGSLVRVSTMISPLHSPSLWASSVLRNPPASLVLCISGFRLLCLSQRDTARCNII